MCGNVLSKLSLIPIAGSPIMHVQFRNRESSYSRETNYLATVEPPNKGHFGSMVFVLYWEAVLWWEVRIMITSESTRVMSIGAIASVLYTG